MFGKVDDARPTSKCVKSCPDRTIGNNVKTQINQHRPRMIANFDWIQELERIIFMENIGARILLLSDASLALRAAHGDRRREKRDGKNGASAP